MCKIPIWDDKTHLHTLLKFIHLKLTEKRAKILKNINPNFVDGATDRPFIFLFNEFDGFLSKLDLRIER